MDIRSVLAECSSEIAAAALKKWPPLYRIPDGHHHRWVLEQLARKPFPAQYHCACALAAGLRKHRGAFLIGEPSSGKTITAITTAAILRASRVIVLAPAHLLGESGKWAREIRETIPSATVVEIASITDADRVIRAEASPRRPLWVLLSRDRAKLGSPWRPAFTPVYLYRQSDMKTLHVWVPTAEKTLRTTGRLAGHPSPTTYAVCPDCGGPVREIKDEMIIYITPEEVSGRQTRCPSCGAALWTCERTHHGRAAYPIGRYLARRARGVFDLLIVDESHEYKGSGTAQGLMLGTLARAAKATLAITATLSSGRASSLFYLLHRISPEFRRQYPYRKPGRFISAYGVRERASTERDIVTVAPSGTVTRRQSVKSTVRELAGLHPSILVHLVDRAAFIHVSDLGTDLPPYREIVHTVPMLPAQRAQYLALQRALAGEVASAARQRRTSLLGVYLQAMLSLPDAPWRGEIVRNPDTGETIATIEPLDPSTVYPKEEKLVEILLAEKAAGRKALVYVTHTGTRDITGRLQSVLSARGIRTATLSASVPPRKREEWLSQAARTADAVIASPRLAGSGLDLVQFSTIVWFEPEYSTYTVRQASRRTWRIGQTRPVNVHFLVYEDSLQESALALVARGILAASTIDGELSLEDRLAAHSSHDHILIELARTIAESNPARHDIGQILRQAAEHEARALAMLDDTRWEPVPPPTPRRPTLPLREFVASKIEQLTLFDLPQDAAARRAAARR